MNEEQFQMIKEMVQELVNAIASISHGDNKYPYGIEGLAMAIAGDGIKNDLSGAIEKAGESIEDGLKEVAISIKELADAITMEK